MCYTSHYITTPTVFGVTIKKNVGIFEVLKVVFLKVQVFWYVMFCRNANSFLGNYLHYDRTSQPTRQDSSEIIPARQKRKIFSLTVREKCRLKTLRSRLRKRRTRGDEMERERNEVI